MCDYSKPICTNQAKVDGVAIATAIATTSNSDEIMSFILRLALKFIKKVLFETCNSSVRVIHFLFVAAVTLAVHFLIHSFSLALSSLFVCIKTY